MVCAWAQLYHDQVLQADEGCDFAFSGGRIGLASRQMWQLFGAVKIRNHEVVGEWHSLINPQRSIPANITRLTGINSDMVQGAPVFAEVADGFMQFMGEGIFVAHSVNFDTGSSLMNTSVSNGASASRSFAPARECGGVIPAINPTALAIFARRTTST